jgi:hypothetical protein
VSNLEPGDYQPGPAERLTADDPVDPAPVRSPVAEALDELATLPERDLAEHPDVYQRIHADLQAALSGIDDA